MSLRVSPFARRTTVLVATLLLAGYVLTTGPATADPRPGEGPAAQFRVTGPRTWADVNAISQTGASVDGISHGMVDVTATPKEVRQIRALGFTVVPEAVVRVQEGVVPPDFPSADSAYHNYAEMTSEVNAIVAAHPTIAT